MSHQNPHPILAEIEAACEKHAVPLSDFGLLAAKDGSLVSGLRDGREPRRAMQVKIRAAIKALDNGSYQSRKKRANVDAE